MNQIKLRTNLSEFLKTIPEIESAVLYGSFARKTQTVNSDIDIAIVVKNTFHVESFYEKIRCLFENEIETSLNVKLRNKVVSIPFIITALIEPELTPDMNTTLDNFPVVCNFSKRAASCGILAAAPVITRAVPWRTSNCDSISG